MLSLHTNAASLSTQNALSANNKGLTSSMTKLGTGFRINSAMDDAAGLQIANRLKAQNSGMAVAMRNTQNGISLMQTAEGALNEVNTMLVRMKDLATQSADASASAADKEAMQSEYDSLAAEITNIIGNTTFGGEKLLNAKTTNEGLGKATVRIDVLTDELGEKSVITGADGSKASDGSGTGLGDAYTDAEAALANAQFAYDEAKTAGTLTTQLGDDLITAKKDFDDADKAYKDQEKLIKSAKAYETALKAAPTEDGKFATALKFQIGSTSSEVMTLDISSQVSALHSALGDVSQKFTSFGVSADLTGNELTKSANATIDKLQTVLDSVGEVRSALGAASNRLEHTNSNLGNMSSTTSAAIGRIMDVDYATETSTMTKNQMLMQASSAMLKQSNSMSQMVASLLQ